MRVTTKCQALRGPRCLPTRAPWRTGRFVEVADLVNESASCPRTGIFLRRHGRNSPLLSADHVLFRTEETVTLEVAPGRTWKVLVSEVHKAQPWGAWCTRTRLRSAKESRSLGHTRRLRCCRRGKAVRAEGVTAHDTA